MVKQETVEDVASAAGKLSSQLQAVAERLDTAENAQAFIDALEANCALWEEMVKAGMRLGWDVPKNIVNLAMSARNQPAKAIHDHDVEALININRTVAQEMVESVARSQMQAAEMGVNMWRDFLFRWNRR
jgi:hypothetical protein